MRLEREAHHVGVAPSLFTGGRRALVARRSAFQWALVSIVGVAAGVYAIAISLLSTRWAPLFVLVALCPVVALVLGNVQRLLIALLIIDIPFQMDVYLGYRPEIAEFGALGGLNISVTTLALAMLYVLWVAALLTRVGLQVRPVLRGSLPMTIFVICSALSLLASSDVTLSLFELFLVLQQFMLYIYLASWLRTRQDILFVVFMLLVVLAAESLVMIGLRLVGHDVRVGSIVGRVDVSTGSVRLGGTVGSPNGAAGYLSLLLAPALGMVLARLGRWYTRVAAFAFGLGVFALILTFSRGGWIAFIVSVLILCLFAWQRGWLSLTAPIAIVCVLLLLSLPFQNDIMTRLLGSDEGSALSRIPLAKLALRMIITHPLLGVGVNNYAVVMPQYITPEFSRDWHYVVHNKYLLVWSEVGVGGLIAFIAFLLGTARRAWQCWKLSDRVLSSLALGFATALTGHMIHMLVDVFHSRPLGQLLWLVMGVVTAMFNLMHGRAEPAEDQIV